ncbi:hypothetical protein BDB01DRAFT_851303 [Pilobolus umbonatus]|nr:hypothetical protein BDB01DRAFT_851303 [Pilobolus umbonatus]
MNRITPLLVLHLSCTHAKWITDTPEVVPRGVSKLFDIPTWIAPMDDYDGDSFNSVTVFSVVLIACSLLSTLYYIFYVYLPSLPVGRRTIGPFNTIIVGYIVATFIAAFTFSLMSAGKVWASFGIFHNLFEIAFLVFFILRNQRLWDRTFITQCSAYLLSTMFLVIVLPWPLDALFFKFQGLATDFALAINLGRLYYHNLELHQLASMGEMNYVTDAEGNDDGMKDDKKAKYSISVPLHSNLYLIYMAAVLHACGNALVTLAHHYYVWILFQFIYAISFPLYSYYCIEVPNSSRIGWYKVDYAKDALAVLIGLVCSGLTIGIGVINRDVL